MDCTSPTRILVTVEGHQEYMYVPCGHCASCRRAKKREWTIRLIHEASFYDDKCFVTLTYRDEDLPVDCGLHKSELQLFFKRLRKRLGPRKIRYFACGEYGDKFNRPHYHAIVFGLSYKDKELIEESWPFGFVSVAPVSIYRFEYVAGYVQKKLTNEDAKNVYGQLQPPFQLQSQGIGREYCDINSSKLLGSLKCQTWDGNTYGLPRYYRKRLGEQLPTGVLREGSFAKIKETLRRHGIRTVSDVDDEWNKALYWNALQDARHPIHESRRIADMTLRQKVERSLERRKQK